MSEPGHRFGFFSPLHSPQRAQLRAATIALVLERGLEGASIEAICACAGFDPDEFRREFTGVRDCALAVYLANIAEFDRVLSAAVDPRDDWRTRLRATVYAAARYIRDRPLSTRFDVVAMLAAGEPAQAHRDRYAGRLIGLIDEGRQEMADPGALSRATAEGIFGSIYRFLARELQGEGRVAHAERIVPQLMAAAVRPYLGTAAAEEELAIPPSPGAITPSGALPP
jgi:AcrR family transcriptional regulator